MAERALRPASALTALASRTGDVAAASMTLLPARGRFSLRGGRDVAEKAAAVARTALPARLGAFGAGEASSLLWLGPDEWLLFVDGAPGQGREAAQALAAALAGLPHSLVDISQRSEGIGVSGPRSEWVLNHGCPLDLHLTAFPVGACTRTLIGKAEVVIARLERETFSIDVWRSFASYVWRLLDGARQELR
jgi:sarcosine oxidase subunit gamma